MITKGCIGDSESQQSVIRGFMGAYGSRYGCKCMVEALLAMVNERHRMILACQGPMYTTYTVRIGEINGLRPSMSALWGLLPSKCAFPKGNAWVYGHQVTEVYVSFGKMNDLRPSMYALEGLTSPSWHSGPGRAGPGPKNNLYL